MTPKKSKQDIVDLAEFAARLPETKMKLRPYQLTAPQSLANREKDDTLMGLVSERSLLDRIVADGFPIASPSVRKRNVCTSNLARETPPSVPTGQFMRKKLEEIQRFEDAQRIVNYGLLGELMRAAVAQLEADCAVDTVMKEDIVSSRSMPDSNPDTPSPM